MSRGEILRDSEIFRWNVQGFLVVGISGSVVCMSASKCQAIEGIRCTALLPSRGKEWEWIDVGETHVQHVIVQRISLC